MGAAYADECSVNATIVSSRNRDDKWVEAYGKDGTDNS